MSVARTVSPDLRAPALGQDQRLKRRRFMDAAARRSVGIGGIAVLAALLLIFVYLVMEVAPLFRGAALEARSEFALPGGPAETVHLSAEEQAEIGLRITASGEATFFDLDQGAVRKQVKLPVNEKLILAAVPLALDREDVALALSDGSVLLARQRYDVSYPGNRRHIEPSLEFPYGDVPIAFMPETPRGLVVREERDVLLLAAADARGQVHLQWHDVQSSLVGGKTLALAGNQVFTPTVSPDRLLVNPLMDWLYVIDAEHGRIAFHRLRGHAAPELISTESVGARVVDARFTAGGISILVADAAGHVGQWFPARRAEADAAGDPQWFLPRVRTFEPSTGEPATAVAVESRRRGFAIGTGSGRIALYYATSHRQLLDEAVFAGPVSALAFEPRARALLAVGPENRLRVFRVDNPHPEISWSALWNRVWYESYDAPEYLWQSSAATSDFEPKFSLMPLTLGTLKGAFYAMIFAVPLAILGAIFTANFMSPSLRQVVKPTVEVMQALPSVVLGFLAGLWLAPFIESYLAGVFLTLILLPLSIPLLGYAWTRVPERIRFRVPPGWEAALLVPAIIAVVWISFALAKPIEALAFGGNLQAWMDATLGVDYDQRNSLVVGIAMGIAVIPGIFTIAEDAIFSVPKHLSLGSLALGATPWQTLVGVVLPTASPGIFSAVMIGLGRAVGETMIVLMATGNTPVMDFSLFSGMRTLSANVAVEMPESEVGSSHFRMLFMAGLVLFIFTFFINTLAEVVRQRLREKYSNL